MKNILFVFLLLSLFGLSAQDDETRKIDLTGQYHEMLDSDHIIIILKDKLYEFFYNQYATFPNPTCTMNEYDVKDFSITKVKDKNSSRQGIRIAGIDSVFVLYTDDPKEVQKMRDTYYKLSTAYDGIKQQLNNRFE